MSIDTAIYSLLTGNSALTALVGARIHNTVADQGDSGAFVVFQQVSGSDINGVRQNTGWKRSRFQFSCFSATPTEARQIGDQVRASIDRHLGAVGAVQIDDAQVVNDMLLFNPVIEMTERTIDYMIDYKE